MDAVMRDEVCFENTSQTWEEVPAEPQAPSTPSSRLHIIAVEGFAVLRHMLPNALSWLYRTRWTHGISCSKIENAIDKTNSANLFLHGSIRLQADKKSSAILFLPGDHAHPYSLLHLADIAEAEGKTVFSIHLPYDDDNHETHRTLLRQGIDKIKNLIQDQGGTLTDFIAAGHSRGAIEAAYAAYVEENPQITKVISLASRLRVIENSAKPCRPKLIDTVNAVYENIMKKSYPPLYQLSAENDWNADREASQVKPDNHLFVRNAMHMNVLFFPETLDQFRLWMRA